MRNEGIARVARQENNWYALAFMVRNQIFAAQFVPAIGFRSLLEKIVRVDNARSVFVLFGLQGEIASSFFAKVGAEKCPYPGAPAFGNRNHDRVAAEKFASAPAQIPPHEAHHLQLDRRPHASA